MRIVVATLAMLMIGAVADTACADPYKWCAVYGGRKGGGSQNCYFLTLEQCRATVSGVGGFCAVNAFYDGRPVTTPEDGPAPKRRSRKVR